LDEEEDLDLPEDLPEDLDEDLDEDEPEDFLLEELEELFLRYLSFNPE
jgi:hypothetical protein